MKKLLSFIIGAIFVFGAYAGNGKGEEAKVTNYKEVLSEIEYPTVCKQKGIEGKVLVDLVVDVTGKVIDHEFVSFPCTDLRDAVKESLFKLRFSPATNDKGEAIRGRFTLPVHFKLTI